jgi:hypothetical protein
MTGVDRCASFNKKIFLINLLAYRFEQSVTKAALAQSPAETREGGFVGGAPHPAESHKLLEWQPVGQRAATMGRRRLSSLSSGPVPEKLCRGRSFCQNADK